MTLERRGNRLSAAAGGRRIRFHIRRFWAEITGRHDFIGLRFKAAGLFYQHRRQFGVPCCAGKTQKRKRLTRQIPSSDHHDPQRELRGLTFARAIGFMKSAKVNAAGSTQIGEK